MRSGAGGAGDLAVASIGPAMESSRPAAPVRNSSFDLALITDVGNKREGNEDSCGHLLENDSVVLFLVADGVGGYEGGEIASAMVVETTLEAFRSSAPDLGTAKRLHRALQRANIEVHNRALAVPELRRMATTATAIAVNFSDGMLYGAHCGDCRLYRVRGRKIEQLTRDHTVVGERVRMGLMTPDRARNHPDRSALSRCLGQDLIPSIDRITTPIQQHDRLIVCSDGLWSVLTDAEIERLTRDADAETVCRRLIDTANERGTPDNLTVGVFVQVAESANSTERRGWRARIAGIFPRGS
jgi:PPM family protein phosphatase